LPGLIWATQYSTLPLPLARHGAARGLDLAGRNTAAHRRLEAVFTETDFVATVRHASVTALLLLAEFCSFRL